MATSPVRSFATVTQKTRRNAVTWPVYKSCKWPARWTASCIRSFCPMELGCTPSQCRTVLWTPSLRFLWRLCCVSMTDELTGWWCILKIGDHWSWQFQPSWNPRLLGWFCTHDIWNVLSGHFSPCMDVPGLCLSSWVYSRQLLGWWSWFRLKQYVVSHNSLYWKKKFCFVFYSPIMTLYNWQGFWGSIGM